MSYSNTTVAAPVGGTTYAPGPAVLTGDRTYIFAWMPTARDQSDLSGEPFPNSRTFARTSQTCYMRGLSEAMNIRTNSGSSWQWRRICFLCKGFTFLTLASSTAQLYTETSNGMVRTMNNINGTVLGNQFLDQLFRGAQNKDWLNVFNAQTDTLKFKIMYDRTTSIASGNEQGLVRTYKRWYPMNKNLVYGDDESGQDMSVSYLSSTSRAGMGDYYVVDFFQPSDGSDQSDTLALLPEATLYWHEK